MSLDLLRVPVLGEMTGDSHELSGCLAKNCPEIVRAVLLTLASVALSTAKKAYNEGSPGFESSPDEDCVFHRHSAGDGVQIDKGTMKGETDTVTEIGHFFVKVVRQLLLETNNEA